jgi:hypothetical protein
VRQHALERAVTVKVSAWAGLANSKLAATRAARRRPEARVLPSTSLIACVRIIASFLY